MTLQASFAARVGTFAVEAELRAAPTEVLAILGPNGSGKSTILAALAGHLAITSGDIRLRDRVLDADGVHIPPALRRVGLLGQRPLLFPHLSALENIAFGPRAQGVTRAQARADAGSWLERVGLADVAASRPAALSGGQQQRVALARALAARPDALLLDEPFAALDVETAAQARRLVMAQRDTAGIPIVLVTHDPLDAVVLAARTAIVQDGRILQEGRTADVLGHPRSPFVAALAGVNLVTGSGTARGTVTGERIEWTGHGDVVPEGMEASVAFAPGSVRLRSLGEIARAANTWNGTVATLEPLPGGMRLHTAEHPTIAVDVPSTVALAAGVAPGIRLRFTVHPDDVSVQVSAMR